MVPSIFAQKPTSIVGRVLALKIWYCLFVHYLSLMEPDKFPIDVHHPLYLHPSDTYITSLVGQVLTGSNNYVVWSRAMRIALRGKNKIGFIDGTFTCTHAYEYVDFWECCDAVVLSWLIQSVDKAIATEIVFVDSSHHVWQDLQERFNKVDGA